LNTGDSGILGGSGDQEILACLLGIITGMNSLLSFFSSVSFHLKSKSQGLCWGKKRYDGIFSNSLKLIYYKGKVLEFSP
jgi:hypothetical protein